MKRFLALLAGKTTLKLSRFLRFGGGSAAPGLFALRLDPKLVKELASQIPTNIVITGTNGKTTTARMIAHFAKNQGLKVIRNHTGSNLERGIASTLIQNSNLHLKGANLNYDLGIWELDEAAFNIVAPKIQPSIIIFLNIFRDQLDRYGEVDSVVKKWGETLKGLPKTTTILVNGDDANTLGLKKYFKGKIQTFGVKDHKILGESIEKRKTISHNFEAKNIKLRGLNGSTFELKTENLSDGPLYKINLPLPGIYHIYDAVAALACISFFSNIPSSRGKPIYQHAKALKNFSPAFGRVEKFSLQPRGLNSGFILLIKNPAGATQVFETIAPEVKKNDKLLFALNDNLADGTDISWIWDANFEKLQTTNYKLFVQEQGHMI